MYDFYIQYYVYTDETYSNIFMSLYGISWNIYIMEVKGIHTFKNNKNLKKF